MQNGLKTTLATSLAIGLAASLAAGTAALPVSDAVEEIHQEYLAQGPRPAAGVDVVVAKRETTAGNMVIPLLDRSPLADV